MGLRRTNYESCLGVNPLSPNSDESEFLFTCSNIQVMRIKEVITKDKMS